MLVAACHDFLTQSGVGMRPSSSCCGKNPAPVVNRAADGSYVNNRHFFLHAPQTWPVHTFQNWMQGLWSALWLLNGSGSTLQPLVRSCIVIYEPRWVVLAKGWISILPISAHSPNLFCGDLGAGTREDAPTLETASSSLFLSLGSPLLSTLLC